jgi:tetratricopeptide (TPR) repeat protein
MTDDVAGTDLPGPGSDGDSRWYLTDEREFLLRSLEDATREHAAGDLSDDDHRLLTERDHRRLDEVEAELAALGPGAIDAEPAEQLPPSVTAGRSPGRRIGIAACCFVIVAGLLFLVIHSRHARQPGQSSSGSITVSQAQTIEQQLTQAATLNNQQKFEAALKLYNAVLSEDPSNPEALAQAGWLQWNIGSSAHVATLLDDGRKEVEKAVKVSPSFYQGHLFLGLILFNQDDNAPAAVTQFNLFLSDDPPAAVLDEVATLVIGAYTKAGVPAPSQLTAVTTTTTTTTTAP